MKDMTRPNDIPLEYLKTENEMVYYRYVPGNMVLDVPEHYYHDEKEFILDIACLCYLVPIDTVAETEDEIIEADVDHYFMAKKGNNILCVLISDGEIVEQYILEVKEPVH